MLRSLKYGTCGAVLAGLVATPLAWLTVDKSVELVVDGKSQSVHTSASDVRELLASKHLSVDAHDLVAPAPGSALHDGMHVVLRHGRLLHLTIDGTERDVWTTAPTVEAALDELGYSTQDFVSVSRSQRLPLSPSAVTIRTPQTVTVVHDGTQDSLTTTDPTVGAVLDDLGITLGKDDRIRPALTTAVANGQTIRIGRVVHRTVVRRETVGYATRHRTDDQLLKGHTQVVQSGRRGVLRVRYSMVYLNGKRIAKTRLSSRVLREPEAKIIAVGTKKPVVHAVAAPQHGSSGGGGVPSAGNPDPGSAKAIARQMLDARGWGDQYGCLVTLWDHESGWRVNAYNPSGAYGIPQALPGSKMASAGADWQTNPATQITWGLNYIAERYGTPCGAWYQWQANGGWY